MKLGKETLDYFERQRKQYDGPVCIVYIDAHGIETMEESCVKDATVFSFAGISGALSFLKKDKNPTSVNYRDMIKHIRPSDTRKVKKATEEMVRIIKPHLSTHFDGLPSSRLVNWAKDNFDEYALTPMKQLKHKKFEFFDPAKKEFFDFGIFILDVIYPPGHPPDERMNLKGQNIISRYFKEFPSASEYVEKLSRNPSNTKYIAKYPLDPNILRIMTFKEIVHLLSLFGFEYSYIFDDSCRENAVRDEKELKRLAKRERIVSLEKLPFKMNSADKSKTRKRILSDKINRSISIPRAKVKADFHEKIEGYLSDKLDEIKEEIDNDEIYTRDIFLTNSKDTQTEMSFELSVMGEDVLYINIFIDFLKVKSIGVKKNKMTPLINKLIVVPFIKALRDLKSFLF
jgi:hypothetical protein